MHLESGEYSFNADMAVMKVGFAMQNRLFFCFLLYLHAVAMAGGSWEMRLKTRRVSNCRVAVK
jgi:hypothetical protein